MERSFSGGSGIPAVLRNLILLVILSAAVVLILSADVLADNVIRIMPLGDSITKGTGSAYGWGYREPLYVSLINGGYSFDFVGGLTDGNFPDPNHEGHYGWRADEILNGKTSDPCAGKLVYWLPVSQPDVILLHIGTNDITQGNQDANEVNSILNVIDAYEVSSGKNIPVVMARIIDRYPNSSATTTYNNDLNTMATKRIANGDNIIIVNMQYALNYSTDMADRLHPNDNGYAKMANVWYGALSDYFNSLTFAISGYVLEADGSTPVKDVLMSTGDTNTLTDINGYYEFSVGYGWSGVVIPEKEGYVFEPNSNTYNNVTQGYSDVNYTATLITFKIAGYVLDSDNSAPISDVNVFTENGGGSWTSRYGGGAMLTDADGYYEVWVDCNWSGNVTSSKYAYVFEPNSRHYEFVDQNWIGDQNYTGNQLDFRITGYIKNECDMSIEGVLVYASNGGGQGTTDVNGFYEIWVDSAWSGVVMPTKTHYMFDPNWMSYVDVLADQPDQNYAAGNIYDLDCDGSVGWSDFEILVNNWPLTGPAVRGDFIRDGVVNFLDFAEFVRVWEDK